MAHYNDPERLKELDYYHLAPTQLSLVQARSLARLLARSTLHSHPNLSETVAYKYAEGKLQKAKKLNAHVGSETSRKPQRYARTMIALAVDPRPDEAVGMVIAANNASAHPEYIVPNPVNRVVPQWPRWATSVAQKAEMRSKLHIIPPSFGWRHHWFGASAVEPRWLPDHAPFPDGPELSILDVLGRMTLGWKWNEQPTSAYPDSREAWWRTTLGSWGMVETIEPPRQIPEFGRPVEASPITITHFIGTIGDMRQAIDAKVDASEVIEHARLSANLVYDNRP